MNCLTCHDPHRDSELVPPAFYEKRCLACHSGRPVEKLARIDYTGIHPLEGENPTWLATPHRTGSVCKVDPARDCLNFRHMPKVRQPTLHTFLTDHYIRVHREEKRQIVGEHVLP